MFIATQQTIAKVCEHCRLNFSKLKHSTVGTMVLESMTATLNDTCKTFKRSGHPGSLIFTRWTWLPCDSSGQWDGQAGGVAPFGWTSPSTSCSFYLSLDPVSFTISSLLFSYELHIQLQNKSTTCPTLLIPLKIFPVGWILQLSRSLFIRLADI